MSRLVLFQGSKYKGIINKALSFISFINHNLNLNLGILIRHFNIIH